MGVIQPGDVSEQVLILKNISLFDIKFRIFLDSLKDQGLIIIIIIIILIIIIM